MRDRSNRLKNVAALIVITLPLFGGCASGSKVELSDAALSGEPSAMWREGQKSVETGEALVSKGEKRLIEGRQQVSDGQAQVSEGNRRVQQARRDYQTAAQVAGGSSTPKEVEAEAKQLRTIGARWEDAIEYIKDGNKLIDRGNKTIDKSQSEIREGRELMESGSTLMRNSQRSRLGDDMLPPVETQP